MNEEDQEISKMVSMLFDLFELNDVTENVAVHTCVSFISTSFKNAGFSAEEFDEVLDEWKSFYRNILSV